MRHSSGKRWRSLDFRFDIPDTARSSPIYAVALCYIVTQNRLLHKAEFGRPRLDNYPQFGYNKPHQPHAEVAERQTRYVQGVVSLRAWEFKSPLRHPQT